MFTLPSNVGHRRACVWCSKGQRKGHWPPILHPSACSQRQARSHRYIRKDRVMNIALWIVQALLALAFGMAGLMKLTQPKQKLAGQMAWVEDFAPNTVKLIGTLELLGAIGLILPLLT